MSKNKKRELHIDGKVWKHIKSKDNKFIHIFAPEGFPQKQLKILRNQLPDCAPGTIKTFITECLIPEDSAPMKIFERIGTEDSKNVPLRLATIEKILEVNEHKNADALEMVRVLGWNVIAKKGEFTVGDYCVYIPIDTVVPAREEFAFLENKNYRVRSIRLRGNLSQGIVFPINILSNFGDLGTLFVGMNLTEIIGIKKFEKQLPTRLAGQAKGGFPTDILSKTDEERIQGVPEVINDFKGKEVIGTIKHDGSSGTFLKTIDGTIHVCSRNLDLKETEGNAFWRMWHKYKIENIPNGFGVQAEVIGPGIQKNREQLKDLEIRVFNVKDLDKDRMLDYAEMVEFCNTHNLPMADVYYNGIFKWDTIEGMLEEADKARYKNGAQAEGIVWRLVKHEYSWQVGKYLSVKTVSNKYLLKHNE